MLTELFRQWSGYVRFRIIGRGGASFLNDAAASQLEIGRITRWGENLIAEIPVSGYRKLRPLARKNQVRLRVESRHGLPFVGLFLRKRPGIAVGFLLFCGLQWFLSGFIWQIEVKGNTQIPAAKILNMAASYGVRTGRQHTEVDESEVRLRLMQDIPELSWAVFNKIGCRVEIEVREREMMPEMVPVEEPCNLKARVSGVIYQIQAEDGFAVVRPGDTVEAGELLVEGMRQDVLGATTLHHARGKILAVTTHTFQSEQPLVCARRSDTDEEIVRRRLAVFGLELPLTWTRAPETGVYRREFSEEPISLLGWELPLSVYTETWIGQKDDQIIISEEEATGLARAETEQQLQQLTEARVLFRDETVQNHSGVVTVTLTVTCIENIAVEDPIYLSTE